MFGIFLISKKKIHPLSCRDNRGVRHLVKAFDTEQQASDFLAQNGKSNCAYLILPVYMISTTNPDA